MPAREAGALPRLQPLASVARAPLFEVRGVRFTHSPCWHTSVKHAWTVCSFKRLFWSFHDLTDDSYEVSCGAYLWWRDQGVRREHSDGWLDRKVCLLTYSLTASRSSTEAHLAGVPFPRSFDSRLALRQSCSACLKSLVGCGCKKTHRFRVLIKAFLVKKKGTKTAVFEQGGQA